MASSRCDRAQSVTAFFAVVVVALLAVAGLVVDGARQTAATRHAQATAQLAARAGTDAMSSARLAGAAGTGEGVSAAERYLGAAGVAGSVTVTTVEVRVRTQVTTTTVFLSIIGIYQLTGRGDATASLQSQR